MIMKFEKWDRHKIRNENWTRFSITPKGREQGREIISRFKIWVEEHVRGKVMYHVMNYSYYITLALSDTNDCVLFRLTFADDPIKVVPQPLATKGR